MNSLDTGAPRTALLADYAGALRQLRAGEYSITLPAARDASLHQLGLEIGALATVLEHRFDEFERLSQISHDMNSGLLLEEILERAYESFRLLIPYDRIGCALINQEKWSLKARWARSTSPNVRIGVGFEQELHGSSLEGIVETGKPRILNDLQDYLSQHPDSVSTRLIVEEGMHASLTCPLVARGKPIGFLFFSSRRAGTYEKVHVDLFRKVAGELSIVVERSLLYERVVELNCQLVAAQRQLEHKANHDALTGLMNRGAIVEELERFAARAMRANTSYGLLLLDIDHFKQFNDQHGHLVGDRCLRLVGQALSDAVRAGEYLGRYGGEEFLVVLDLHGASELQAAAERFRRAIAAVELHVAGGAAHVTASVGGAIGAPPDGAAVERVLANADAALYAAKAGGRNCIVIHPRRVALGG